MSDIKDNLYSQILSLNENEVRIFLALMQDKLLEESTAVPDITPPEGMTKADCKRLIKSIRTKQPYADARTQPYSSTSKAQHGQRLTWKTKKRIIVN